ncbi:tetratricopeptide repeat protein [Pontibacterium granulatum]|uniref:tetratricopeptide repeat protein n=1 Tax=Pontibacterium granulatum TaxID=2036029 RepID=UPI00249AEFB2|nr:tetratricopeptide repeat protein [Pontibacterium granulatum]MDI3324782.1 tetratricopeptide repeat protein [Pontibacterium granulatum]
MLSDQQGNPLSGATPTALEQYNQAVIAFNLYRGDPFAHLDTAIEDAPDFAMAYILKAYLCATATEPDAVQAALSNVDKAKSLSLNDRERSHIAALNLVLNGNWDAAAIALDHHNAAYPLDLVGIQCGHLMDFYRANARGLRDRIARVLPKWSPEIPGYSILLGMYAFGLEESGNYGRAEENGRQAVEMEPLDCWAHHAVAHVMEMQGRVEDGVGWMTTREPYWSGEDNFFKVHNWWHLALYHLDLGQTDAALALYDGPVREDRSAVALDMVDASALLWRLALLDCDLADRWQELATMWDQHADGKLYPFNDWHAVMAYLGAGRSQEVERILTTYKALTSPVNQVEMWAQQVGLPLVEGFAAFWHGDYKQAAEKLYSARVIVNRFGGSHAQRDIIDWTLTEAALRGGLTDLAEALANERLALKPHSLMNRNFLSRAGSGSAVGH